MPKDDLTPKSGTIQPASYSTTQEGASLAGQAVIQANSEVIDHFVGAQRTMVNNSTLDQHRQALDTPDVYVEYRYSYGHENVHVIPTIPPEVPPPTIVEIPYEPDPPVPYDFPEPPEVVTPDLYMMVIYNDPMVDGRARTAAYAMSSLGLSKSGDAGAVLTSSQRLSMDTDLKKNRILTCQISLEGKLSIICTGCDLTGKSDGTKLMVMTAGTISKPMATTMTIEKFPFMNGKLQGKSAMIYTGSDAFTYGEGRLTKTTSSEYPSYAIDTDGTLYFTSNIFSYGISYITNTMSMSGIISALQAPDPNDPNSPPKETTDPTNILNDLDDAYYKIAEKGTPTVAMSYTYATTDYKTVTNRRSDNTVGEFFTVYTSVDQHDASTFHVGGMSTIDYDRPLKPGEKVHDLRADGIPLSEQNGTLYYVMCSYGEKPSLDTSNVHFAFTNTYNPHYDEAANQDTFKLSMKTMEDFSGKLPIPLFDPKKNELKVDLQDVTATAKCMHDPKTDPPIDNLINFRNMGFIIPTDPVTGVPTGEPGYSPNLEANVTRDPDPVVIPNPGSAGAGDETDTEASSEDALGTFQIGDTYTFKKLALEVAGGDPSGAASLFDSLYITRGPSAETTFTDNSATTDFIYPNDRDQNRTEHTGGPSSSGPDPGELYTYYPKLIKTYDDQPTKTMDVMWDDAEVKENQTLAIHAFPFNLKDKIGSKEHKSFYSLTKDGSTTITTPYDTYDGKEFVGWCHLSNASVMIQGFDTMTLTKDDSGTPMVSDIERHLYLSVISGKEDQKTVKGPGDLMKFLKKNLKLNATKDVLAVFIDLQLSDITILKKVTSKRPSRVTDDDGTKQADAPDMTILPNYGGEDMGTGGAL